MPFEFIHARQHARIILGNLAKLGLVRHFKYRHAKRAIARHHRPKYQHFPRSEFLVRVLITAPSWAVMSKGNVGRGGISLAK